MAAARDHAILDLGEDDLQFTTNDYKSSAVSLIIQIWKECPVFCFGSLKPVNISNL